jgi:polyisoprenoid-binding protein YceI
MTRFLLAMAVLVPSLAAAKTYELDPAHTVVGFDVRHIMSLQHGRFKKVKGTVELDDKALDKAKIDVEIESASVSTDNDTRDNHLRSPDFFDAANHPKLTFKSKSVKPAGKDGAKVTGDLTIRGVTKEVTLDVTGLTPEIKDPFGGLVRAAHAVTKINRTDFGLKWNKALEAGGVLVGEEVIIVLDIEMKPKAPATATK